MPGKSSSPDEANAAVYNPDPNGQWNGGVTGNAPTPPWQAPDAPPPGQPPVQKSAPFDWNLNPSWDLGTAMKMANDNAYGYNKHTDQGYWQNMWSKDPNYTWNRMIGQGAGPQDAARYGKWAGGDPNAEVFNAPRGQASPGQGLPQSGVNIMAGQQGQNAMFDRAQMNEKNQKLIDLLMSRATQSLSIDPTTDKVIRPQVDNFAATQERQRRNFLNDLAESNSPYSTGAMQTAATQSSEVAGQNTANLESELVGRELTSRRQEIQDALQQMGQLLTSDQEMALREELGKIDAALRGTQIGNQNSQFYSDLGLRNRALNSQNDQYLSDLGFRSADRASYWDALRRGLLG